MCCRTRSCTRAGRVQQVAVDLIALDAIGRERERHRQIVAAAGANAEKSMLRRSSRGGVPVLSRPHVKPMDLIDSASSRDGGSPARPDGRCSRPTCTSPFRNVPVVTTSAPTAVRVAALEREPDDAGAVDLDATRASDNPRDVRFLTERTVHPLAVAAFVGLRARRPDGRSAASVEQLELDPCRVDREPHQAAERVDLANEVPLRRAAHRGVAGHVRDRRLRQRADGHAPPHARRGPRGLDARMAGADDDHVEVWILCKVIGNANYSLLKTITARHSVRWSRRFPEVREAAKTAKTSNRVSFAIFASFVFIAIGPADTIWCLALLLPIQNRAKISCSTSSERARARDLFQPLSRLVEIREHELLGRSRGGGGLRAFERRACAAQEIDVTNVGDRRHVAQRFARRRRRRARHEAGRSLHRSSPTRRWRPHRSAWRCPTPPGDRTCWPRSRADVSAVASSSAPSSASSGPRSIENDEDHVRDVTGRQRPRDALDLDRIDRAGMDARGVDEGHRDAADVDRFGHQIARRPGCRR